MLEKTITAVFVVPALVVGLVCSSTADIEVHPGFIHPFSKQHVNYLAGMVDPDCAVVEKVAGEMSTLADAFYYVRDRIKYIPQVPAEPPWRSVVYGAGSCYGKAILLCSIYRAMGATGDQVHVVLGEVEVDGRHLPHSWVEIEHGGERLLLDPSGLLGIFDWGATPRDTYHEKFVVNRLYTFNDTGLLSQP